MHVPAATGGDDERCTAHGGGGRRCQQPGCSKGAATCPRPEFHIFLPKFHCAIAHQSHPNFMNIALKCAT